MDRRRSPSGRAGRQKRRGADQPARRKSRLPGPIRRADQARVSPLLQRDQQSPALVPAALSLGHAPSPDITHETWTAWTDGYEAVNRQFAEEILADLRRMRPTSRSSCCRTITSISRAGFIRELRPQAILQHFVHIPWPDPDYWRLLPTKIRRQICEGMLGNDVDRIPDARSCPQLYVHLRGVCARVQIDYSGRGIIWNGRRIEVRAYPISIDVEAVRRAAPTARKRAITIAICPNYLNEFTVLRVDRAEPSKNIDPRVPCLRAVPGGASGIPRPGQLRRDHGAVADGCARVPGLPR